jgi:hypothetical protein
MVWVVLLGARSRALPFRHSAAKDSRRIVAEALAAWEPDVDLHAVESCTSELVTDALRHGGRPLHLVIQHWTDCVRVMVINGGLCEGEETDNAPYGESAVRQRIVDALATGRGVEQRPVGTAAWFDVETRPDSIRLAR